MAEVSVAAEVKLAAAMADFAADPRVRYCLACPAVDWGKVAVLAGAEETGSVPAVAAAAKAAVAAVAAAVAAADAADSTVEKSEAAVTQDLPGSATSKASQRMGCRG